MTKNTAKQAPVLWQDKVLLLAPMFSAMLSLWRQRQMDPLTLLSGTGIFNEDLVNPHFRVSAKQLDMVLTNAGKHWPGNELPFLLGQLWLVSHEGGLLNTCLAAPSPAAMIRVFNLTFHASHPWLQSRPWQGRTHQHFIIHTDLLVKHRAFLLCFSLSAIQTRWLQCFGHDPQWQLAFDWPEPEDISHYYKYLGLELSFNQPLCRVSIPHHALGRELNTWSPAWCLARRQTLQTFQRKPQLGLPAYVRESLYIQGLNQTQMAQQLAMSPATLKRRLGEYSVSFGQLQDEVKLLKALCGLTYEQDTQSLSRALKFTDTSNFRRAFRRWTGELPARFKLWMA